jgi:hypothetical protein
MAQKYYNVKETAGKLGISEAEVKQMLDRRELYGYRDGADWKFKVEDIERKAKERQAEAPPPVEEDEGDVLLSEVELGQSDPGLSGTVIGVGKGKASAESDIQIGASDIQIGASDIQIGASDIQLADSDVGLAASDVRLAESDIKLVDSDVQLAAPKKAAPAKKDPVQAKVSQFEELDMTLDQDLSLEDSHVPISPATAKGGKKGTGDSAVDLSGKALDDDDLVLGGSGTGSDITIGGDSGISLVDPADSGLSLEEPLNLSSAGDESLELGEDDLLSYSAENSAAGLKSEDDFQLTPLEDAGDADDSESGSQVIALDVEGEGDDAATMIAGGGVAAMLDEDLSGESPLGLAPVPVGAGGRGLGLEAQPEGLALSTQVLQPAALLPEAPYTIWNVLGLLMCVLLLLLVGMMMYDVLRNVWSWDSQAHVQPINSSIINWLLNLFEK